MPFCNLLLYTQCRDVNQPLHPLWAPFPRQGRTLGSPSELSQGADGARSSWAQHVAAPCSMASCCPCQLLLCLVGLCTSVWQNSVPENGFLWDISGRKHSLWAPNPQKIILLSLVLRLGGLEDTWNQIFTCTKHLCTSVYILTCTKHPSTAGRSPH